MQIGDEFISYSNDVSYRDGFAGISFFRTFQITCKVKKLGQTGTLTIDTLTDRGLIDGGKGLADEIEFHEYVQLVVMDRPEGAANEFRLGEKITVGLDFDELGDKFDYRLNRCWALSDNHDGKLEYIFISKLYPLGEINVELHICTLVCLFRTLSFILVSAQGHFLFDRIY